jgi:hypothetical protein
MHLQPVGGINASQDKILILLELCKKFLRCVWAVLLDCRYRKEKKLMLKHKEKAKQMHVLKNAGIGVQ